MFRRDKWWHREIERIRRDAATREAELIETICRLAGKPAVKPHVRDDGDTVPRTWTPSPEQLPAD